MSDPFGRYVPASVESRASRVAEYLRTHRKAFVAVVASVVSFVAASVGDQSAIYAVAVAAASYLGVSVTRNKRSR